MYKIIVWILTTCAVGRLKNAQCVCAGDVELLKFYLMKWDLRIRSMSFLCYLLEALFSFGQVINRSMIEAIFWAPHAWGEPEMTIQTLLIEAHDICMLTVCIPRNINQYMRFAWKVDFGIVCVLCILLINSSVHAFSIDPCHSLYHYHHHH